MQKIKNKIKKSQRKKNALNLNGKLDLNNLMVRLSGVYS